MFEDIKDRRVLITGANGGIGSAIADLFADHGAKLGLHYRKNNEETEKMLNKIKNRSLHNMTIIFIIKVIKYL